MPKQKKGELEIFVVLDVYSVYTQALYAINYIELNVFVHLHSTESEDH